jgi:heme-degrading monooxygenase HmoA
MRQTSPIQEGGAVYTSGIWNVKKGHEDDFRRGWQESVDAVSLELPGIVFRLLRDVENPRRFISTAGPWRGLEQITAMRSSSEFKASMASMAKHLDSYEISACELVAEVS